MIVKNFINAIKVFVRLFSSFHSNCEMKMKNWFPNFQLALSHEALKSVSSSGWPGQGGQSHHFAEIKKIFNQKLINNVLLISFMCEA